MANGPKLFRIDTEKHESTSLREVDFAHLGLKERADIQEWVAAHPDILGDDLLIVAKEFSDFNRTNERPDLLAIDREGNLVVIELKRDDSGADAYWQAVKYASYFRRASPSNIVEMLSDYSKISNDEAEELLLRHLDADDLDTLNSEQRIILASHRFAAEATSAVLWLNEKFSDESLITCVQLTPYQDEVSNSLYLQSNTIIPLAGEEEFTVQVGERNIAVGSGGSLGEKLRRTFARNRNDEVSVFFRKVRELVLGDLSGTLRPDRHSNWAGDNNHFRYYKFWYNRPPWKNWGFSFPAILLHSENEPGKRHELVGLEPWDAHPELKKTLESLPIHENQHFDTEGRIVVEHTSAEFDDAFAEEVAGTFRQFIQEVTPIVDDFTQQEANQEDA